MTSSTVPGRGRLLVGISVLWVPLAFLFDGVTVLLLPLRLGGDATTLGLVSGIGLAIAAGLQPFAGWLSDHLRDRVDRRVFVVLAAIPTTAGLWTLAGTTGLLAAVVGYVVVQVGATAMQAGQQTLIPEHVEGTGRGTASGAKTFADVGGAFAAFLVLGVVLAVGGLVSAALVTTILLVVSVGLLAALVPAGARTGRVRGPAFLLPPGLGPLIVARFLFLFATYAVGRFLLLLVAERAGIPAERAVDEAGGLLAVFALTTAVAALVVGPIADRRPGPDLMVAGALVAAVGIVALTPPTGLVGVTVGGLLMSIGTAAFVTANWSATTALVPPADAGRLMAIANLGTGLAAAAAGAVGPLIDASGFVPALLLAAGASAASIVPVAARRFGPRAARERST